MVELLLTLIAGLAGYFVARNFVSRRLRFVDAIQSPFAPLVAGLAATAVTWPLTLLPLVSFTTAVVAGVGTALGTARGARMVRRGESEVRRLAP